MKTPSSCLTEDAIRDLLRQRGLQVTAQRVAICRHVLCEADHPTVEDVKDWAARNFGKVSQATVYNTLNLLVEEGLLRALRLPHSERTVFDNNMDEHCHLLDDASGKLMDVPAAVIDLPASVKEEWDILGADVFLRGVRRV